MPNVPTERIRNVVVVGHGGVGKTSLCEALLYRAGAVSRLGRTEDGTTVSDAEPEEHARRQSLSLSLLPVEWLGHKLNVLDTPGYADFEGDVLAAMDVADLAVFVVSAVEGPEVQTERFWREAAARALPRMFFVNKLDRERASFERTLDQLRATFGAGVAPLELPIGEESEFHGIANLLTDRAYLYDTGVAVETDIPDEMADLEHQVHDNLVEGIVVADDALLEGYLEGRVPSVEELERTLARGVDDALVFPVVCGAATVPIGVDRLADFICEIGPSPRDRPPVTATAGDTTIEIVCDPSGPPLARVFKIVGDAFVGQITLAKLLSGSLRNDDHLTNTRTRHDERLHGIFTLRGHEHLDLPEVVAGDLFAVAKLTDVHAGDTLAPKHQPVVLAAPRRMAPVYALAIVPRTQADDDKLATGLAKLEAEDPSLHVVRDDETHQTVLWGQGETHLMIAIERLARKFGVHVDTDEVRIAYRETITAPAEAEGKHKKQSGGRGQFGVAVVKIEPLPRGEGFAFVDAIVGGVISRGYIPAVEKGIVETMTRGGVHGFPVVDVKATLFDGKEHSVDSDEMSFRMAGRLAFREAMAKAAPVVLEPVSHLEVTVPAELAGEVMGDLNARRGRVQGTDTDGEGNQVVAAHVPTAELRRYAIDLRSLTGGRGTFVAAFDHYDTLPAHLVDAVRRDVHDE